MANLKKTIEIWSRAQLEAAPGPQVRVEIQFMGLVGRVKV